MRQTAPRPGRRRFLAGIGTAVAAGLAGCSGGGGDAGDGGSGGGGDGGDDGDGGDGAESTPMPTEASGDGGGVPDLEPAGDVVGSDARGRVDEYLSDVGNYDGEIMDGTGRDEVVVAVGAEGNGGNFAFRYPAVAVSPGTTVSWQWTGEGGQHNVVSDGSTDFDFDSGSTQTSGEFEHAFDSAGVGLYVCEPHASLGMKGAVVVVSG